MSENTSEYSCDILIAGSGFAGSLTALLLHQSGFKVCLVERNKHPRFAIGESSTPIADMILRDMARQYDLPWLSDFSRYGTWRQHHPGITCGLKRGFSYFKHFPGEEFHTDHHHKNELLVAAGSNDYRSDTHWFRADFDAFLVEKVKEYGIPYLDSTDIKSVRKDREWLFSALRLEEPVSIQTSFYIDATGSAGLLESLFGVKSTSEGFQTHSYAVFSHFENVSRWQDYLQNAGVPTSDYPYHPDHSALHQVLDEGWMWMLRFNSNRLSMGLVLDGTRNHLRGRSAEEIWKEILFRYPSIKSLMDNASLADEPGKLLQTGRLQRRLERAVGEGWAALPHTVGFIDPLHSTGIAHTLSGVEKIVKILSGHWDTDLLDERLRYYEQSVFQELKFMDVLVAGCFKTFSHFDLFATWSMLYFTAAIAYEQNRLKGVVPLHFLQANEDNIWKMVHTSYDELARMLDKEMPSDQVISHFIATIRKRIKPWNIAGLLDPSAKNMYRHTAVEM